MGPHNPEVMQARVVPRFVQAVRDVANSYFERPLHFLGFGGAGIILVLGAIGRDAPLSVWCITGVAIAGAYIERYFENKKAR